MSKDKIIIDHPLGVLMPQGMLNTMSIVLTPEGKLRSVSLDSLFLETNKATNFLEIAYNRLGIVGIIDIKPHSLSKITILTKDKCYDAYLDYTKAYSMNPDIIDTESKSAFQAWNPYYSEFMECLYYITYYKLAEENKITQEDKENLTCQLKYCLAHNYIKNITFNSVTNMTVSGIIPRINDTTISHLVSLARSQITEDWESEVIKIIPWLKKMDSCYVAAFELLCIKHQREVDIFGDNYFSKTKYSDGYDYLVMNPDGLDDVFNYGLVDNEIDLDGMIDSRDNLAVVSWLSGVKSALTEMEEYFYGDKL